MPTLDWIGKAAVVRHHQEVPTRLLEPVAKLSCAPEGVSPAETGNLIVQGDNLHALKALLPRYAGQVKCIYIDPPYNTGNEGWVYNDNVNSPEINKWLGDTVGKEAEDLCRHDKWLCMMYPRLVLLKQFLRPDGAIFISLDDNEISSLRCVMDEIFGRENFVATILWQKVYSPKNSAKHLSEDHDYVVIYASKASIWRPELTVRGEEQDAAYKNRDDDPRGPWKTSDLSARNPYSEGLYPIITPSGRLISGPPKGRYWTISETRFKELDRDKRIWWGKKMDSIPQLKRFLSDVKQGVVPQTMWFYKDVGHTQEAKKELIDIVPFKTSDDVFITPKPTRLIERILQIASNPGDLILDSFAGSGTTGHAVLKMNAAQPEQAPRRFILVEMDEGIARNITAERVRRVAEGYTNAKKEKVAGLGGGFQFATLSHKALFDRSGAIDESVRFLPLAEFVWLCETGTGYPGKGKSPLLGVHQGAAIYLLYNGILGDRSDLGGNVLNQRTLDVLPVAKNVRERVVYGARCRFTPTRLKELGITFKQLPYQLLHRV